MSSRRSRWCPTTCRNTYYRDGFGWQHCAEAIDGFPPCLGSGGLQAVMLVVLSRPANCSKDPVIRRLCVWPYEGNGLVGGGPIGILCLSSHPTESPIQGNKSCATSGSLCSSGPRLCPPLRRSNTRLVALTLLGRTRPALAPRPFTLGSTTLPQRPPRQLRL